MYKRVNSLKGEFKKKERFLKHDDRMLITIEKEIAKQWRKYLNKLLNCEEPTEKFNYNILEDTNTHEYPPPSLEEIKIKTQMQKLKIINLQPKTVYKQIY